MAVAIMENQPANVVGSFSGLAQYIRIGKTRILGFIEIIPE
jgi:hypothetical protein